MVSTMSETPTQVKHILMIDDDEMMRVLFREMFWIYSPVETHITTVASIAEAYKVLEETRQDPDVIVLGLSLLTKAADGSATHETQPSLNFIDEMKSKNKSVQIIVYSHHSEADLKEKAKEVGADHYIVKGEMTPKEIVDFVEQL